ncbi:MAG: glutathione S-transferase family protein [Gammaproteobacteria bacterium]|jgi:glutathione S-transferase|nr:glutathione S-transferase family protein [Gammaproteobacteria bacterium]
MKFYNFPGAPSPRRVRIFLAEKGASVETVSVDMRAREQLSPAFRARNPRCTLPVLELDDGSFLFETVAICQYLENVFPEPNLMGRDPKEMAQVLMWNRLIEADGFDAVAEALRNSVPGLAGRALTGPREHAQIPELVERGRLRAGDLFAELDRQLADREFLLGDRLLLPDITALVVVDFAARAKIRAPEQLGNLSRWHAAMSARPSAAA